MLNINSGLSASEAFTCSTMVPTVVLSFRENESECCPNMGALSFMFVIVTNTSALDDMAGIPTREVRKEYKYDTFRETILIG